MGGYKMNKKDIRKQECIEDLRKDLKPGDTVYCILRHVSRYGMYRVISLYTQDLRKIDHLAADLLEGWDDRHSGCKASGCGMDMGFHLVYNLGRQLFPKGFKVAKDRGRNGDTSGWDNDGGYALKCKWL
jgi:hypothetical protein